MVAVAGMLWPLWLVADGKLVHFAGEVRERFHRVQALVLLDDTPVFGGFVDGVLDVQDVEGRVAVLGCLDGVCVCAWWEVSQGGGQGAEVDGFAWCPEDVDDSGLFDVHGLVLLVRWCGAAGAAALHGVRRPRFRVAC